MTIRSKVYEPPVDPKDEPVPDPHFDPASMSEVQRVNYRAARNVLYGADKESAREELLRRLSRYDGDLLQKMLDAYLAIFDSTEYLLIYKPIAYPQGERAMSPRFMMNGDPADMLGLVEYARSAFRVLSIEELKRCGWLEALLPYMRTQFKHTKSAPADPTPEATDE